MACVGCSLTVALGMGTVGPPTMGPVPAPGGRGPPAVGFCKGTVGAPVSVRGAGAAGFWLSGRVAAGRPAIGGAAGRGAVGAPGGLGAVGGAMGRAGGGIEPEGAGAVGGGDEATGTAEVVFLEGGDIGGAGSFTGVVLDFGAGGGSGAEGS